MVEPLPWEIPVPTPASTPIESCTTCGTTLLQGTTAATTTITGMVITDEAVQALIIGIILGYIIHEVL